MGAMEAAEGRAIAVASAMVPKGATAGTKGVKRGGGGAASSRLQLTPATALHACHSSLIAGEAVVWGRHG